MECPVTSPSAETIESPKGGRTESLPGWCDRYDWGVRYISSSATPRSVEEKGFQRRAIDLSMAKANQPQVQVGSSNQCGKVSMAVDTEATMELRFSGKIISLPLSEHNPEIDFDLVPDSAAPIVVSSLSTPPPLLSSAVPHCYAIARGIGLQTFHFG